MIQSCKGRSRRGGENNSTLFSQGTFRPRTWSNFGCSHILDQRLSASPWGKKIAPFQTVWEGVLCHSLRMHMEQQGWENDMHPAGWVLEFTQKTEGKACYLLCMEEKLRQRWQEAHTNLLSPLKKEAHSGVRALGSRSWLWDGPEAQQAPVYSLESLSSNLTLAEGILFHGYGFDGVTVLPCLRALSWTSRLMFLGLPKLG